MSDYKNLEEWCKEYSKITGVKIYPQTAPLQLVLEDVVGKINKLRGLYEDFLPIIAEINTKISRLENLQGGKKKEEKK